MGTREAILGVTRRKRGCLIERRQGGVEKEEERERGGGRNRVDRKMMSSNSQCMGGRVLQQEISKC